MTQIAKDWRELSYLHKTGHLPTPEKKKEKIEKWQLVYGKLVLADGVPYPMLVEKKKLYQRFGHIYKDKTLFKIIPAQ